MTEKLSRTDIKFLKDEITQRLLSYGLLIVIFPIIYFSCYVFIYKWDFFEDKDLAQTYLLVSLCIILFLVIYQGLEKLIKDITCNQKHILSGNISKKFTILKYTYTMNPVVDLTSKSKPRLAEHYFTINDIAYFVSKEQNNNFNEGDLIQISFSFHTNKIIDIEKG